VKKVHLLLTLALVVSMAQAAPVETPTGNAAKQVLAREQARTAALEHSDVPTLERTMADDVTYIHASGKVDTKKSYLVTFPGAHEFACPRPRKWCGKWCGHRWRVRRESNGFSSSARPIRY
jgi:hypothetical protein